MEIDEKKGRIARPLGCFLVINLGRKGGSAAACGGCIGIFNDKLRAF